MINFNKIANLPLFIVFISLFFVACVVTLIFSIIKKPLIRFIFKPQCLLFLGLSLVVAIPDKPLIYIACFMAMIGDFCLQIKKDYFFIIGGFSFGAFHIMTIINQLTLFKNITIPVIGYVLMPLFVILFALFGFMLAKDGNKKFQTLMFAYFGVIIINIFIAVLAIYVRAYSAIWILIGYLFFGLSDSLLCYCKLKKPFKLNDLIVMVTYLIAVTTISVGYLVYLTA